MDKFIGILGIIILLFFAYILSNNRTKINYKTIIYGLSLQLLFALSFEFLLFEN